MELLFKSLIEAFLLSWTSYHGRYVKSRPIDQPLVFHNPIFKILSWVFVLSAVGLGIYLIFNDWKALILAILLTFPINIFIKRYLN